MRTYAQKQQPQQRKSGDLPRPSAASVRSLDTHPIMNLQRTMGNQAVQRLLHGNTDLEGQIKSALETPPSTFMLTQGEAIRETVSGAATGKPLSPDARAAMEMRFGYDFSRVRVQTDSQAAADLGAKAFTSGQHIWFRPGRGPWDRPLLAHEIAHVIQQATGEANGLHGAGGDKSRREVLEIRAGDQDKRTENLTHLPYQPLRPLPLPSLAPTVLQFDFEEDVLRELHRLPSAEEEVLSEAEQRRRAGVIAGRMARLHALFGRASAEEARRYHERLRVRRRGDALSERFHDILSTALRDQLLGVLADKNLPHAPRSYDRMLVTSEVRRQFEFVLLQPRFRR